MLAAGISYEAVALARRRHATLSNVTRTAFRTHHPVGRWAFGITWGVFSLWYLAHVIDPERTPAL